MTYDPLDFMGKEDRERLHGMVQAHAVMQAASCDIPDDTDFLLRTVSALIVKLKNESILNSPQETC